MMTISLLAVGVGFVGSAGCVGLLGVERSWRRVGGLRFWRVGRLGGSFYVAARRSGAAVKGAV
jgi:hypothetical protein